MKQVIASLILFASIFVAASGYAQKTVCPPNHMLVKIYNKSDSVVLSDGYVRGSSNVMRVLLPNVTKNHPLKTCIKYKNKSKKRLHLKIHYKGFNPTNNQSFRCSFIFRGTADNYTINTHCHPLLTSSAGKFKSWVTYCVAATPNQLAKCPK